MFTVVGDVDTVTTIVLGDVHSAIGGVQQVIGEFAVLGESRHSDRGADLPTRRRRAASVPAGGGSGEAELGLAGMRCPPGGWSRVAVNAA